MDYIPTIYIYITAKKLQKGLHGAPPGSDPAPRRHHLDRDQRRQAGTVARV